jgi:NAD(P)-dependent dehydrogenase (short-subunit alcohol dehydrogenase family)
VIALTQSLALELAPVVRVNAVSPGYVLTLMQRAEYSDAIYVMDGAETTGGLCSQWTHE